MYKRFYHSKRRYILWAIVVILTQAALFFRYPGVATVFERAFFGLINPLPILVPLYFSIVYGIISRHWIMSAIVGLTSGWTAPLIILLQRQDHPFRNAIPATIADGVIYAIIGFLAAEITIWVNRRKVASS